MNDAKTHLKVGAAAEGGGDVGGSTVRKEEKQLNSPEDVGTVAAVSMVPYVRVSDEGTEEERSDWCLI